MHRHTYKPQNHWDFSGSWSHVESHVSNQMQEMNESQPENLNRHPRDSLKVTSYDALEHMLLLFDIIGGTILPYGVSDVAHLT